MKTKTTLAALLLAAVMVTPSYGAEEAFLRGAKDWLRRVENEEIIDFTAFGFFTGYVRATVDCHKVKTPYGATLLQVHSVVALYVSSHPEHHHQSHLELVKRACKEAWPNENKHVFVSK